MRNDYSFRTLLCLSLFMSAYSFCMAADNQLSEKESAAGWTLMFDGKTFADWKLDKWSPNAFKVEDGSIKCYGNHSMAYYDGAKKDFVDFHFVADVMTKKGANSGIFFHTKYQDRGWPIGHEAQVNCTQGDPVKTGSVYIVEKYMQQAHKDDKWFRYEIIVRGKTVTTKVDGKTIVIYKEPSNTRGSRKLSEGTFALQAHDPGSIVFYKNIKVKGLSGVLSRADRVAMRNGKWFEKMDFGPALQSTVGTKKGAVLKGIAVRVGTDESDTFLYDSEMMSLNSAWTGWLQINGTAWDGRHGGFPKTQGEALFTSQVGPGWAKEGSFKDPRKASYGPLPADWLKYKGRYVNGDNTVIAYTVGDSKVLEMPAREKIGKDSAFTRTFNIADAKEKMTLRVINSDKEIDILGDDKNPEVVAAANGVKAIKSEFAQVDEKGVMTFKHSALQKMKVDGVRIKIPGDGKILNIAEVEIYSGPKNISKEATGTQSSYFGNFTVERLVDGNYGSFVHTKTEKEPWVKFSFSKSVQVDMVKVWHRGGYADRFAGGILEFLQGDRVVGVVNSDGQPSAEDPITGALSVGIVGGVLKLYQPSPGQVLVDIPKGSKNVAFKIVMAGKVVNLEACSAAENLTSFTKGGGIQWAETFKASAEEMKSKKVGPYITDEISLPPDKNPWASNIRFSGFDFFADGKSAAICTWNGDVWILSGIDKDLKNLTWKRYAAGLFETLGLKIIDDLVYVTGKDQITCLHDLNKDGEADFYQNFNNDIMITSNFHEFTFDLQTDKEGNFYFAKAAPVRNGGRGFEETHAHHGVVFKVSKDGTKSEVHANGLRAPGGMGVGPNGEVTTGENEGTYVPACKINWASKGTFSGVIHSGNGRKMEQGYDKPLCFLPMLVDNSGGGQVWVDENNKKWGPFAGDLIHLSYGRSKVYKVMKQEVDGVVQGGVFEMPIRLSSSAMRARFNPADGQMWVSGFKGWQTNAARNTSLQRIRYSGKAVATPQTMRVTKNGVYITFTQKLEKELAEDITSYNVTWWNYLWSPQYGSGHFSVNNPDQEKLNRAMKKESHAGGTGRRGVSKPNFDGDRVVVKSVKIQPDGKTVFLEIPTIRPVMQMRIKLDVETEDGDEIITSIYNTIHKLTEK